MKEYQEIKLYTNTEANPFLLFFIWLLLTILPFFIISESLDYYLKESEKRILSKTKTELLNEINEFRHDLTSDNYINSKLSYFNNEIFNNNYNAFLLSQELEKLTKSVVVAVFYYNSSNNFLDLYINKEFSQELGIPSKYSMKNLLLDYASIDDDDSKRARSKIYFEQLLSAGKINLKEEVATPILSGKKKLGKMLGYFKVFNKNNSDKKMFLCLFRIKDIPLKEISKNAIENTKIKNFKRELINSKNLLKIKSDSDILDNLYFKFNQNEKGDLSIFSKASDEFLLRLGTIDSYYPLNLKNLIENEPILKVTSSKSNLEHPMRGIINKLRFPTLLLIIFTTIVIVRIGIFGYTARIKILGRVILCVLAGVLLPFTSFILTAYYNQYFEEEYSENEIQLNTQIQTEVINKSIEEYINNREYAILELRNRISGLPQEEFDKILREWIIDSCASLISYKYLDSNEIIISASSNDQLIQLGKEAKSLIDICLNIYFSRIDLSQINSIENIKEKYTFEPKTLTKVLSNFGEINPSVPNEPDALYSMFPIFENENTAQKIIGSILIKFNTYKIIRELPKTNPDLFQEINIDNYVIRNAVIPVNRKGDLPNLNKVLFTKGFDYHNNIDKINQILNDKSYITWKTENTINTGTYCNNINSIIISTATRNDNNTIVNTKLEIKYIVIYVLFMILTLSIILSAIIVTPIRLLQKSSKIISKGIYTNKTQWKSGDEFEKLSLAFNEMTDALAQKELMTSYVSKDIVNEVSNKNEVMLQPGGEKIPVTVLFCTIKGERELSDYSPKEVTKIISCLIDTADEISSKFNGQIDKLIEDTVMIVFRQIDEKDKIVLKACQAALAINEILQKNLPDFRINMGIASGDAVSGKIGSRNGKLDYTVIGNPVNLAARLKAQAYKAKTTGILLCPNSIRQLHGAGRLKFIERISIKGRTNRTFPLYELISLRK